MTAHNAKLTVQTAEVASTIGHEAVYTFVEMDNQRVFVRGVKDGDVLTKSEVRRLSTYVADLDTPSPAPTDDADDTQE